MARYGIRTDHALGGSSLYFLRAMAKGLGKDHALALALWSTDVHEARLLATLVEDPQEVTEEQMEAWVADFDSWDICDQCTSNVFSYTSRGWTKAVEWSSREEEFVKRAGFALMAALAGRQEAENAIGVVEIARGLPVLLVMLFGWLGFNMQPLSAVVFGLTLYNMAIFAEILRAGLAALPRGQAEASLAIGMTRWQTLLSIELPQAVRTMTPSLIAQLVVLLKDSSLGFIIGYVELLRVIQRNTAFFGADYTVALFVVGAGVYLAINISLSRLAIRLQRRGSRRSAGTIDKQKLTVATAMLDPTGGLDKSTGF